MRVGRAFKFLSYSCATYYAGVNAHLHYHLFTSKDIDVPHPVWNSPDESKAAFQKHQKLVIATENLIRGQLAPSDVNKYFNKQLFYNSHFLSLNNETILKYFLGPFRHRVEIEPVMEYHTNCGFCLLLKFDPGKKSWFSPLYSTCLLFVNMQDDKVSGMTFHVNQKCFITGSFKRNRVMGPQHDFIRTVNSFFVDAILSVIPNSAKM